MFLAYIKFLIRCQLKPNSINLERIDENSSHDHWLRFLNGSYSIKKQIERITCPKKLRRGVLLIDDTVIEIPFGRMSEGASWVYSSKDHKTVFGYQVVMLIWTDGEKREIIDFKIYNSKQKTKIELALELLSYARNSLQLRPDWVIFDSWYAGFKMLKRVMDYGWFFITSFRKNRYFDGKKLESYQNGPYWSKIGYIRHGLKLLITKNGYKYYVTNRLTASRSEILKSYQLRQNIEETFKQLSFLGFKICQSRTIKAKENHFYLVILAFSILERKRRQIGCSLYELRTEAILGKQDISDAYLERLLKVA